MPGKFALLIGNSAFQDEGLARLSAPENDVIALREVLESPVIAGFSTRLCLNAGMDEARTAVAELFQNRDPSDTVLLYYTGHGLRDENGDLFLALPATRVASPRSISLEASYIRAEMRSSAAERQVLILDCCHSGAVMPDGAKSATGAPVLVKTDLDPGGTGRYILAASSANESAYEGPDGRSIYTRCLVEGLRSGAAAPEENDITINDLHAYVAAQVAAGKAPMRPRLWVDQQTAPLVIARNPKPVRPLPPGLVEAVRDADELRASGAVDRLAGLMNGPDARLAAAARAALQGILDHPEKLDYRIGLSIREALGPPAAAASPDPRADTMARHLAEMQAQHAADAARWQAERAAMAAEASALKAAPPAPDSGVTAVARRRLVWVWGLAAGLFLTLAGAGALIVSGMAEIERLRQGWIETDAELATLQAENERLVAASGSLETEKAALQAEIDRLRQPPVDPVPVTASASEVREAQQLLEKAGVYDGPADGVAGAMTAEGVRKFQRLNGLLATGTLNPATLATLRTVVPAVVEPPPPFRDCDACPDMMMIPSGRFQMGSPDSEAGRQPEEGPQKEITIAGFAMARTEVTFDQWDACVRDGFCTGNPKPSGSTWGRGSRPVINVTWKDAQEFVGWLNSKTGDLSYHLPSEAEWEYAARAGTTTPFAFGDRLTTRLANYDATPEPPEFGLPPARMQTVEVDDPAIIAANDWGLRHMHGNVWEWVEDCFHADYSGRPQDNRAWLFEGGGDCGQRMARGGSWNSPADRLRSAVREKGPPAYADNELGFRVAKTLTAP